MNLRAFKLLYRTWWAGKPSRPPYNHVVQIGDPVLRQKSNPVDLKNINNEFMKQVFIFKLMSLDFLKIDNPI